MNIVHHGGRGNNVMKARWAHVRFTLFQSVDVTAFLEPPLVVKARPARLFGETLASLQDPELSANPATLAVLARRKELGFALLRELCGVSTLRTGSLEDFRQLQRLAPALRHLRENLHRPLHVAELAARVCLSSPRFHELFHRALRKPPSRYLQELRFNDARHKLLATDMNLSEISESIGYSDPFHFSRFFKTKANMSPSEYRKRHADLTV
jgi:AraC-like DNA-binding protein